MLEGKKRHLRPLGSETGKEESADDEILDDEYADDEYGDELRPALATGGLRQQATVIGDGNRVNLAGGDVIHGGVRASARTRSRRVPGHPDKVRILLLGADSNDRGRLRIDRESKAIDDALNQALDGGRHFDLRKHLAVQARELQTLLLRHEPHIVHFCGHGERGHLCLDDADGSPATVPGRGLAKLFGLSRKTIRCVVLNACDTARQARAISRAIDCAIGMERPIEDRASIAFAHAFYNALAHGRTVQEAFDLACNELTVLGLEGEQIPRIFCRHRACRRLRFATARNHA